MLVDVCNAFNSPNRETTLWNILHLCHPTIIIENMSIYSYSYMETPYSPKKEPLIKSLENDETKVWFADDTTAGGSLTGLRKWSDLLVERGPGFGYYPNPTC